MKAVTEAEKSVTTNKKPDSGITHSLLIRSVVHFIGLV
jgi:hypothetical protein